MMLDLFITHYKEPWEVCAPGFKMLSVQRCVDWSQIRVTIVHDGTPAFPEECFQDLPFTVNQVTIPHRGIAGVRNWCIENGDAEWIKWNDIDDSFYGLFSVRDMMDGLNKARDYDLLWFDLMWDDHGKIYCRVERDPVFVHNKCFRRSFLKEHEVRFNEDLTWCEDSAFMAVVEMEIDHKRIGRINCRNAIYTYIVRDGSLCNRPEILFQNRQSFFKRHCYVADEFLKRGLIDQYNTMCVRVMADSYYTCRKAPLPDDTSEHEKEVWRWYDDHREAFHACTPDNFLFALRAVNRECFDGGEISDGEFLQWIYNHERGEK